MGMATLRIDSEHLEGLRGALDLYVRLGTGELEALVGLVRDGRIKPAFDDGGPDLCDSLEAHTNTMKVLLGLPAKGHRSISSDQVDATFKQAFQMKQMIDHSLSAHNDRFPDVGGDMEDAIGGKLVEGRLPLVTILKSNEDKVAHERA